MESYQTEEQQVEAIKSFWQENGNAIIAGIVIGLGGYVGWGYYQDSVKSEQEAVSSSYQKMMDTRGANEASFGEVANQFVQANENTAYSAFTGLALAKEAVDAKDWTKAEEYLSQASQNAPTQELQAIALIRLARVQIQQKNYANALATLAKPMPAAFLANIEEAKGDAYLQEGNKELARTAYQTAVDAMEQGAANPALQIKLDDLALADNANK